jgi:signal transduction histidine kinase
MMLKRRSIAVQAARRLVFSLGLFVIVVGLSTAAFYRTALDKAATERANDLRAFYVSRLTQIERDWEVQARDFRVRIEYARILEQPHTAVLNLQAFMTVQGSGRNFRYLLIGSQKGEPIFRFGKGMSSAGLIAQLMEGADYYLDAETRQLYRVYEEPIWLGNQGMGRMWVFFRIDHALLGHLASPGVTLSVAYNGTPLASSLGARGLLPQVTMPNARSRTLPWRGRADDPVQMTISAPVKLLFSTMELALAVSVIPVLDGLILWFALGTWLMGHTRRINALDRALRHASGKTRDRRDMDQNLRAASAGHNDEIHAVAETFRRTTALRDEVERRNANLNDNLRRQNEQLEAVNAELESFIYSVSHDLRAPLRAIAGFSTILEEDYGKKLDAAGKDYLKRIETCATRMSERMDALLNLSLISRHEIVCTEVDLGRLATELIAELRDSAPARRIETRVGEGLVAFADARLLGVALSNLLANAWKFTAHTVAPCVEVDAVEQDGERVFFVRDNGAGFDPAFIERMFLPFHRLHPDTEFEGTGLGLAIVERVIRRHGGRVWAEGAVGQGATIYFTL